MTRSRRCGRRSSRCRGAPASSADALGANITHRIQIRYSADITLRHRFRDGDTIYRIVAIRERDKRFLDIDAERRID